MLLRRYIEYVLVITASFVGYVTSLKCYQCTSSSNSSCQENFVHSLEGIALQATDCSVNEAAYCIKITGVWGGVAGTHRFCSSRDMGIQCQYIRYEDHDRLYMACVYTCGSDGCNHTPALYPRYHRLLLGVTSLLFSWFYFVR